MGLSKMPLAVCQPYFSQGLSATGRWEARWTTFHLLKLMSINGRHQVSEIAEFLGISPAAASKNMDKLEGLGLVIRTPSEGDRRATLLSLSTKGRRLVAAYEELKASRLYPMLDKFKPEEIKRFSRLLERFSMEVLKLETGEEQEISNGYCMRCSAYLESECPVGDIRGGCPYQRVHEAHLTANAELKKK